MASQAPTSQQVREWLQAVEADIRRLQGKMEPLLEEQGRLEAREALLRDLLSSFDARPQTDGADRSLASRAQGSVGAYVVSHAIEILREAGSPLHINELHKRFLQQGLKVPGAGTPANLIVHIRKAPEIASPKRGMYGLTENIGPVLRRRKKRAVSRSRRKG
jgi:hypothetical protein